MKNLTYNKKNAEKYEKYKENYISALAISTAALLTTREALLSDDDIKYIYNHYLKILEMRKIRW